MPKSRTRKKSNDSRASGRQAPRSSGPLDSLLGSDWNAPSAGYAAEMTAIFAPAEEVVGPFDRAFVIRVGDRTIRWEL